ncbi:hypothetical protein GALMADRAFT_139423 [Galerina marginata CBS 339.88]|uniref:F-box domain-containing protein n=1 Tax=Galerina marginata (strain CBS 339.88) TaxID=685588 RepID=A0A067SZZ5_GALM3|nr:hypothetical protein GALMADRAFT_139423 [Galerina marginata CBS 339.88]
MSKPSNDHTTGNYEASHVQLPPELFEVIIYHLEVELYSLKNSALVCRVFAHHCQKHLFKRITLGRPFQSSKPAIVSLVWPTQRLYEVLNKSPNLCKLVEELEISDAGIKNFVQEEWSWIRWDSKLSQILPMLNNLKELSIRGDHMGSKLNFRAWKPELKLAIWRKCQTISKLSLGFMRNVPLTLMKFAPSLTALSSHKVLFIPDDAIFPFTTESAIPATRAEVKSLTISTIFYDEWISLYPWLTLESGNPDLSHLVSLDLDVNIIDEPRGESINVFKAVRQLVHNSTNTVRSLSLYFPTEEVAYYDPNYFDLGSMPSLRHFALNGCIWVDSVFMRVNNVRWVLNNLTKIPLSSSLQSICLNLTVDCGVDFRPASAEWMNFATEITKLERSIDVFVSISIVGGLASYAKSLLDKYLAPLLEKGIAEVILDTGITDGESI